MIRLMTLLLLFMSLGAAETWNPHDHPASINRQLTGYTEAIYHLEVSSEVSARVKTIPLDVGQTAGNDDYIQLDDTLAHIDLSLARAQLKQAQSQVLTAEAHLNLAIIEERYRNKEKDRINTLLDQHVVSDEKRDGIVFTYDQARLAVLRHQAQLENTRQQVAIAEVQILRSQELLQRHRITIPSGWTVVRRNAEIQSLARIGSPLLQMQDLRTLIMRFSLSEDEVLALRQQDTVQIQLLQQQTSVAVSIKSISPEFNPTTRKREVVLQAPASLFPEASGGLNCSLTISIKDPHQHILIPQNFISKRFDQNRVQLADNSWLPVIIIRYDNEYAVVQQEKLPAACTLIIPSLDGAD